MQLHYKNVHKKNIQKGVNSALQSLSLPQKPIKNILNGPYGHPYTGRSIINNSPIEEGGIFDKIKKLKKIIFDGDDKLSDTLKYAGENIIKVAKEAIDIIL